MPSANKTERLGLNLWEGSDRPQRNDFNSDNGIIESVLGDHVENNGIHLTEDEKTKVNKPIVSVSYLGDGEAQRIITLPAVVTSVIVFCDSYPCAVYDTASGCVRNYSGISMYGSGSSAGVDFNRSTVTVSQDTQAAQGFMTCLNEKAKTYRVIGFR